MAKLDLGTPEKFGPLHSFLRNFWFLLWFKLWYKDITIIGKKNLDRNVPTILAINHQNTAMDPLVLCGTILRQITWLARADLYKKKAFVPLLHCFKILPIFRQRDGVKSLENNDLVFEKVVEVISAKKLVGLFPEGTHWGFRRLRQTRKAIPRIVYMAEEKNNFNMDININPVGIYYEDYVDIRKNLFIKIGEPITIRQYLDSLQNNTQVAENEIRIAVEEGLRNSMIDIPHLDELYDTIDSLRFICRQQTMNKFSFEGNHQEREFYADKKTIELIERQEKNETGFITRLKEKVDIYETLRKKQNYSYELVENDGFDAFHVIWDCMKLLVLFPFFVCGCLTCSLNYWAMNKLGDKLVKDILFKNSIMFVGGRLMSNITHTIFAILWLIYVPLPWWTVFLFVLFLFYVWTVFVDYPRLFKKTKDELVFNGKLLSKDAELQNLISARDVIKSEFEQVLNTNH